METNYKWIVYLTINKVNKKIYVGVHKTKDPTIFDGYIGCGVYITQPYTYKNPKTHFQYAVKKYGVQNFIRQTIQIFDDATSAYDLEYRIVNEDFLKREDVYNMILGGEYIIPPKVTVYQYDITGKYIKTYNSIQEAADFNKVTHGAIDHAIALKQKSCNSYWATDKLDQLDLSLYNKGTNHKIPVYVYDILGNLIQSCSSEQECANFCGVTIATIRQDLLFNCTVRNRYKVSFVLANTFSEANTIYTMNRKVYQYSSTGEYLAEYTQQEALKKYPKSNISKCIQMKKEDTYGYLWALIKVPNYLSKKNRSNSSRKVGKYTLEGKLVKIYESATKAAKENGTSVWKVLSGTNKTHKQHIYKYLT